jgi:hypothetical protein
MGENDWGNASIRKYTTFYTMKRANKLGVAQGELRELINFLVGWLDSHMVDDDMIDDACVSHCTVV